MLQLITPKKVLTFNIKCSIVSNPYIPKVYCFSKNSKDRQDVKAHRIIILIPNIQNRKMARE